MIRMAVDQDTKALTFLRISVGVLFLIFAQYKVFGPQFTLGGGFQHWINRFIEDGAYPFMLPILRGFVLPHGTAIAFHVTRCIPADVENGSGVPCHNGDTLGMPPPPPASIETSRC